MDRPDKQFWLDAMNQEYQSLIENDTWELCKLPSTHKAIKNKWVFCTKRDEQGNIIKYKARLVIKGCSQKYGIDYQEVFAPVVRYSSIRYLMGLAVKFDLDIDQMDAVTAFLQGELNGEELYMMQPIGFSNNTNQVCRLKRALYGLKQSSRVWNRKLDEELKKYGLQQSQLDPCIYFTYQDGNVLIVTVYVDDLLIFSNNKQIKSHFRNYLLSTFKMKDLGEVQNCLGFKITRDRKNGKLYLSQKQYIIDILEKYNMKNSKPISTPMDPNVKYDQSMCPQTEGERMEMARIPYREAIGSLLYVAQISRPDIYYAVHVLSQYNSNPGKEHWKGIKRIFRYLNGTIDLKLVYCQDPSGNVIGYSDADWAGCINTRRSTSGYIFMFQGAPISWSSKKQQSVALSSCEAEYVALSNATQEAMWWYNLQKEIDEEMPIEMNVDNQSAINLASNNSYSTRTKHIDIRFHFVKEVVADNKIEIQYCPTEKQAADILTKPIGSVKMTQNYKLLSMSN